MSRTTKIGSHPPRWFINDVWTSRDRQAVRADCRTALKEHRGHGAVDVVPPTAQHRHNAQWLWW